MFYLTQKNSAIIFKRDTGVPLYHLAGIGSHHDTPLSYKTATYNPIRGSFFLFPAWLDHWVEPNQEDDRRISIAFNYSYP